MTKLRIGVLCVQGGFLEHVEMIRRIDCEPVDVRKPSDLDGIHGIVLPGGESTTIGLVANNNNLIAAIRSKIHEEKLPVFGTCAGLIVMSNDVTEQRKGGQALFGGLSTVVARNGFGRQINSFEAKVSVPNGVPIQPKGEEIFIRAPIVVECTSEDVQVVATLTHSFKDKCDPNAKDAPPAENQDVIVGVRQGPIMCLSFHPELTDDTCWHAYFKQMIQETMVAARS